MNKLSASVFYFLLFSALLALNSCVGTYQKIKVMNPLAIDRSAETVEIAREDLKNLPDGFNPEHLLLKDAATKEPMLCQWLDYDLDGKPDELIFQVDIKAEGQKNVVLIRDKKGALKQPQSERTTFSRFVPERIDDYAWENDRVAFRTYGPEAQRLVEEKLPGGTLSSGIDLWLKRVPYPVIDKWYTKNTEIASYYHIDHGEGYDPYHVGTSRGTGGAGVWIRDTLLAGKNFIRYRSIATGPIRTVFELDYAPWSDYGIAETKRISLDLGANFSRFEVRLNAAQAPPNYTLGITLHDGKGEPALNEKEGWFRHWEPIDDSFVGEGIVLDPALLARAFVHRTSKPDQSQLLISTSPRDGRLTYYAGFAWLKSGQIGSMADWEAMLRHKAQCIAHPLEVKILP